MYKLDLATGRKELWKQLKPLDPAGIAWTGSVQVPPDGMSYARALRSGNIHALEFVEKLKLEECVEAVAEYMKIDAGSPLLGIFAMMKIGSPRAIPHLLEYAKREFTSRKNEEREWRFSNT